MTEPADFSTDRTAGGQPVAVQGEHGPRPTPGGVCLDDLYRDELAFVWRTVRYLGIADADAEDVVHEVFLVVGRRLADFDGMHSMRSWLAGITRNVVQHQHRSRFRAERKHAALEAVARVPAHPLDTEVMRREAAEALEMFLGGLDEEKRTVFVLTELEGMTAPEIAHVMGAKVNTVYSRLRSAREAFEAHVARMRRIARRESG